MTVEPPAARPEGPPSHDVVTGIYIAAVAALGLGLTAWAVTSQGLVIDQTLVVLGLLAVLTWWSGPPIDGRYFITFSSIILLAAMALLGPAGAGIVGVISGPLERGPLSLRARVFNLGMTATLGVLGGYAYLAVDGSTDSTDLVGAGPIVRQIGVPILVADLVQVAVNLVLIVGVIRLTAGGSMTARAGELLRSTGPAYLGYGVVAFLMVVLWEPAGLGPFSVVLVLAPLFVARWAYAQYAEEAKAHEQTLDVLVASVEAKAPHLTGHSARVADLSAAMAEHLGLRGPAVADIRVAGMLHDLGQTTLPTGLVRGVGVGHGVGELEDYPARGVEVLRGISFLSGSLDAVARHREVLRGAPSTEGVDAALVVGVADEFDLLTEVGTPDGALLHADEAIEILRTIPAAREDVVQALLHALSRRGTAVQS